MSSSNRKPRKWQSDHLEKAQTHYASGGKVFLSQAVTGAGKTTFGSLLASLMLRGGIISRIVVLCPSVEISEGWKSKLSGMDIVASTENVEALDVVAVVFTYQGGGKAIGNANTLLILDEIHHAEREASWGLLADNLANSCKFVLALTTVTTRKTIIILNRQENQEHIL
jgi:superfamily II DNA or RNA helicase